MRARIIGAAAGVATLLALGCGGGFSSVNDTGEAGATDGGGPDADAGTSDTGMSDTGMSDTGTSDTGTSDTGTSDTGTSDTGTSDTGTSDTGGTDAVSDAPSFPCDQGFSFDPDPLGTGSVAIVGFTHEQPLTNVEIGASGPGVALQGSVTQTSANPFAWAWPMTFDAPGAWTFEFRADPSQTIYGTCKKHVSNTGATPPLPLPD